MADPSDDEWQIARTTATEYFQPAATVRDRKQILEWGKTPGNWSGNGKHTKFSDVKGKFHSDEILGHGGTGTVDRVTFRSVTMARKKIRVPGMFVQQFREEANIMEKLVHRHIVELVGTYTHGQRELCILTYPAAICNLQGFLDDIEDIRNDTSADVKDSSKRFEALGFKNVVSSRGDLELKSLDRPLHFLASTLGCVTEAVMFVHKKGVRHQDLKPRNILLSPQQVYLADFGISRDLRDATHSLTEAFPGGTRSYLAPEVIEGEKHHMSPADIYSLGCVFMTLATVLYAAPHEQYEMVMKEEDLNKKGIAVKKHLEQLRERAEKLGKAAHDATTCAPKHLLGLIEWMLQRDPIERPTACNVNSTLHELGGIDQVYHGPCCKKDSSYITQLIDNKFEKTKSANIDQAKMIERLQAQHEMDRQKIEQFSKTQATYESLVERERKHVVEQYKKLLDQRDKDLAEAKAARKSLEAEVAQLRRQRHPPRNEKKGRFPQMLLSNANLPQQESNGGLQQFNSPVRRPSRVPVPSRPSTPLRPNYNRESSSGNNTINSSVDSLFSEKSVRSSSPESPISAKGTEVPSLKGSSMASSSVIGSSMAGSSLRSSLAGNSIRSSLKDSSSIHNSWTGTSLKETPESPVDVKEEAGKSARPVMRTMRTWAEITSKPAVENATSITPLQTVTKKQGVLAKSIKT